MRSGPDCSLGLGMVERYAKREGYTVIATARDPKGMPQVETGTGSKVIVVTMDQSKPKGCLEVSHLSRRILQL